MSAVDTIQSTLGEVKDKVMGVNSLQSKEEPPSGIQGNGTIDVPYDQGNAPENVAVKSVEEPLSGVQGKGTASDPYDQGNAGEAATSATPANSSTSNASAPEKKSSNKPAGERINPLNQPSKNRVQERDVSPGTMPDGSHAQTSGDRGESYEPAKGFSKLKGKLGIGRH